MSLEDSCGWRSGRGGFKAPKDGLIICRHAVRDFNRHCQPCLWVQRGADFPAWCPYWRYINFENKGRKAEAQGFDPTKICQLPLFYMLHYTKACSLTKMKPLKMCQTDKCLRFSPLNWRSMPKSSAIKVKYYPTRIQWSYKRSSTELLLLILLFLEVANIILVWKLLVCYKENLKMYAPGKNL